MCVIMVADGDTRITEEMLRGGFDKNKAGAGAAWREEGRVRWSKGLALDDIIKLNETVPLPYVVHFRNPSMNTALGPYACHPFAVDENASVMLDGIIEGDVLFHNGFWGDWRNKVIETAARGIFKLPTGSWSDSRALAWMTHHLGPGLLELVDQKVVLFGPEGEVEIFGDGWKRENDIWFSNMDWKPGTITVHDRRNHGGWNRTSREGSGGDQATADSFRQARGSTGTGGDQQETIQKGAEEAAGTDKTEETKGKTRRPVGFLTGAEAEISQICTGCGKGDARIFAQGVGRCFDCWDKAKGPQRSETRSATCDFCPKGGTGTAAPAVAMHRLSGTYEWICGPCWAGKGRPSLVGTSAEAGNQEEFTRRDRIRRAALAGAAVVVSASH